MGINDFAQTAGSIAVIVVFLVMAWYLNWAFSLFAIAWIGMNIYDVFNIPMKIKRRRVKKTRQ